MYRLKMMCSGGRLADFKVLARNFSLSQNVGSGAEGKKTSVAQIDPEEIRRRIVKGSNFN
jgi:hypothetical protein